MENEMTKVVQALACLSQNYDIIFTLNLDTGECEDIKFGEDIADSIVKFDPLPERTGYQERMGLMASTLVHPNDLKQFIESTSLLHIRSELQEKENLIVSYRVIIDAETRYYQTKYVRDTSCKGLFAVVGIRNCTDEFKGDISHTITADRTTFEKVEAGRRADLVSNFAGQNLSDEKLAKLENFENIWNSFLYGMAHGLRTPLNAILGLASMVDKYADDPERVRELTAKLRGSGREMLNLINEGLCMSRLQSGSAKLDEVPADLSECCSEVAAGFDEIAKRKSIAYSYDFSKIRDNLVYTDVLNMNRIMHNLIGNAVEYTNPGGKVRFYVEQLTSENNNTGRYRFVVSDTGVGIRKELLEHIFAIYTYDRRDRMSVVRGTGFGLTIVKSLIDMMNGTIDISSEPGVGTTVTCTVPLRLRSGEDDRNDADKPGVNLYGRRVLLVEDNALGREVARDLLENEHLIVEEASDGAVAVDMVYDSEPGYYDFILMDIRMPYMDGYTATREIRAISNKQLANIPIIALSANAFEEDRERAIEAGMDEHLSKPIDIKALLRVLSKYDKNNNS